MKKEVWQRKQEKWVRKGWQRYTTYYQKTQLEFLKKNSQDRQMHIMDVLAEIIDEYAKHTK